MKKTAVLLLSAFMLVFSLITVFATEGESALFPAEAEIASDEDEFTSLVEQLVEKDNADSFFSEIVIDKTENTITKDGNEEKQLSDYSVDYTASDTDESLLAAQPLLDALGLEGRIDNKSGEIIVTDPATEEKTVLDGISSSAEDTSEGAENMYISPYQLSERLAVETENTDDKIIVTSPFQTKRLLVTTKSKAELKNTHNAEKCIGDGEGLYILQFKTEVETREAYVTLKKDASVENVSIDKVYTASSISERYGAHTIQSDRYKEYLKENGKNSQIIVAVIDTGVDSDHPFLKSRLIKKGYNAYGKNTNWEDDHGHGTHVSGIVADNTPSNVKILPIKVLGADGSGSSLAVKLGIEKAVKLGADVINMSLGASCNEDNCPIEEASLAAVKKGVTVVVAAGNECDDTKDYCPASVKKCITVASTSRLGSTVSSFSNYGEEVDLAAPGELILSAQMGGGYCEMSGTSMATPFVAAAAAMLLTDEPSLTPAKVQSKLKSYSADMLTKGHDISSGYGVLNLGIALGDDIKADQLSFYYDGLEIEYFGIGIPYIVQPSVFLADESLVPTDRSVSVSISDSSVATYTGNQFIPEGTGKVSLTLSLSNGDTRTANISITDSGTWLVKAADSYAGGKGTKESPYLISNASQLAKFSLDCLMKETKYSYKLIKDIDLSGRTWISAAYMPDDMIIYIGDYEEVLFDGNNHKIKNMTVFDNRHSNSLWYVGLSDKHNKLYNANYGFFANVKNATIKNLGIENGYTSHSRAGLLAAEIYENTHISGCYTSGFSAGNGLFDRANNFNIKISDCYSSATVLRNGICTELYSSFTPGGTTISNVFFCGESLSTQLDETSGGFAQMIDNLGSYQTYVYNCFSATKNPNGVGFCDEAITSVISKCYYLNSNTVGVKTADKMKKNQTKAKSEDFFKKKSTYTDTSLWNSKYKWDFDKVWAIDGKTNNGYPYLKNNKPRTLTEEKTDTWLDYAADSFAGGNGTSESPYLIKNAQQLARISKLYRYGGGLDTYFKLVNDIDLGAHNWFPIGAGKDIDSVFNDKLPIRLTEDDGITKYRFYGNIDGNGKTVSNMKIESTGDYIGFIAIAQEGIIKNLNFKNATISGNEYCGVVTGLNRIKSSVINCNVSGNIAFDIKEWSGAICGKNYQTGKIIGCTSTETLCGKNLGIISMCFTPSYLATESEGVIANCYSYEYIASPVIYNSYTKTKSGSAEYIDVYGDYYGNIKEHTKVKVDEFSAKELCSGWDFETVWVMKDGDKEPKLRKYKIPDETLPTERWSDVATTSFAGGDGSKDNPFLIATAEQLAAIKTYRDESGNSCYRLIRDIDLSGKLWDSVVQDGYFGVILSLDGNGKTISGMTTENGVGLFDIAIMEDCVIENLTMKDFHGETVNAIAPINYGTIRNCRVICDNIATSVFRRDDVILENRAGGIVGLNEGLIEKCEVDVTVLCDFPSGAVADYNAGIIRNCSTRGFVLGMYADCVSSGIYEAVVENCYSLTTVLGDLRSSPSCKSYTNSYSAADFSGEITYNKVYYSEDLKKKETFVGWDFDTVWDIDPNKNDGYPFIRQPQARKITYVLNGGRNPKYVQKTYIPGNVCTLQKPTRENYTFRGWYTDKELTKKVTKIGSKDSGNITLYAKWKRNSYSVAFDANGGTGKMSKQTGFEYGKSKALSKCTFTPPTGKVFAGWATSKDGKAVYTNGQKVKNLTSKNGATVKLYAKWVTPKKYTIRYDTNGGKLPDGAKTYYKSGKGYTLPEPTRKGYTFLGWYTDEKLEKGKISVIRPWRTDDIKLYAKWERNSYSVAFNPNGGTGEMAVQSGFKYDKAKALKKCTFTAPKGKVFAGWATSKDGKAVYTDGQKVKNLSSKNGKTVTLYAKWKKA